MGHGGDDFDLLVVFAFAFDSPMVGVVSFRDNGAIEVYAVVKDSGFARFVLG